MTLREQFEKEMNSPGTVFGMPDYINWLENKLETIVQQPLSGSTDATPKSCSTCKYKCTGQTNAMCTENEYCDYEPA